MHQFVVNQLQNNADGSNKTGIFQEPNNYSLYIQRKKWLLVLKDKGGDRGEEFIPSEIEFTKEIIRANIKNYQIWNHLRFLHKEFDVSFLDNNFFMEIFQMDTRNCYLFDYLNWYSVNYKDNDNLNKLVGLMLATESTNNSVLVLKNTLNEVKT